jgi:hypothetical protein
MGMATNSATANSMRPRKRIARGPARPRYLASRDLDRMMIMFVTLMGEVSALRDRLDTHEALADAGRTSRTDEVEGFKVTDERLSHREQQRLAMARRVFRVLADELGSKANDAAHADMSDIDIHT